MASAEEERLVEMVHQFIESESTCSHHSSNSMPPPTPDDQTNCYTHTLLQEIVSCRTKAEAEVHERVSKHMTTINNMDVISCADQTQNQREMRKLVVMKLKMDGYSASLCHTSWPTALGCPAGDYEYIDINNEEEGSISKTTKRKKRRVIVDLDFKSQFEVVRPTPAYKHLTDLLPTLFVGTEDKLIQIISVLCSAAKHSLTERGLHVPPWRTTAYVHSKYLSNCSRHSDYDNNYVTKREWAPPNPDLLLDKRNKTIRTNLGGTASALSTQFSNMSINCC